MTSGFTHLLILYHLKCIQNFAALTHPFAMPLTGHLWQSIHLVSLLLWKPVLILSYNSQTPSSSRKSNLPQWLHDTEKKKSIFHLSVSSKSPKNVLRQESTESPYLQSCRFCVKPPDEDLSRLASSDPTDSFKALICPVCVTTWE